MRKDYRPYIIKKIYLEFQQWYVNRFLRPRLKYLGKGTLFTKPWHVEIFGGPVEIGDCVHVMASSDKKVRLTVWSLTTESGRIHIGNYCFISPGVRISAALDIAIGDSCMIAHSAYITDSDWHDIYDRVSGGKPLPVKIGNNVWIGDSAIICKGVTIGDNSIIGAGAVVVWDIPPNSVAAGNPAGVVKQLDSHIKITTRADCFLNPELMAQVDKLDRDFIKDNTLLGWLRSLASPMKED